jgi:hypothetical protein
VGGGGVRMDVDVDREGEGDMDGARTDRPLRVGIMSDRNAVNAVPRTFLPSTSTLNPNGTATSTVCAPVSSTYTLHLR